MLDVDDMVPGIPIANLMPLMQAAAVLMITMGGAAFIFQARKFGTRILLAGVGLVILTSYVGQVSIPVTIISLYDIIAFAIAISGIALFISGRPRAAVSVALLPLSRWLLWPVLSPSFSIVPLWTILLALAPFAVFLGIFLLQRSLSPIYGREAAAHVAGTYLVRVFDGIWSLVIWLIAAPFRFLQRFRAR